MYNYFMLVGILLYDVEVKEVSSGKRVANITLAIKREFKNNEGEFQYDHLRVTLWEMNAEIAADVLKKGDKVGIKGRIVGKREQHAEGYNMHVNELVAERLIFFENPNKEQDTINEANEDDLKTNDEKRE